MKAALLLAVFLFQASSWSFTLIDSDGTTVLDTNGVKIIFEGVRMGPNGGRGAGTFRINGGGGGGASGIGRGDSALTSSYANGACTIIFAGHTLTLTENGKKLSFGAQAFDLSDGKKTIVVKSTGEAEVQKPK